MMNLTRSFTMRKDGVLPRGDWFTFKNKTGSNPKLYIYDEIGFWGTSASSLVEDLKEIDAKEIDVHLNSPGGEIFDGLAIYNTLKEHDAKINVHIDGLAASAASFIAQAGDTVQMARNAQMMIHDGIAFAYGNEKALREVADLVSRLSDNIADIYSQAAKRRGFATSLEEFRAFMREEIWYNGSEALAAGLCDSVTDRDEEEIEEAKNTWDLGLYNSAGRENAESPLRLIEKVRLSNKKENNMSDAPSGTVDPNVTPDPGTGDPAPGTDAPPAEPDQTTQSDPAPAPAPVPAQPEPYNSQGVMINGKLETDWGVINRHFAQISAASQEQTAVNRADFVKKLAADNKIAAPQIDSLINLVNGKDNVPPMSPDQYAAFQASYESAAPIVALGAIPDSGAPGGKTNKVDASGRTRADLEGIVAMHQRNGMSPDQLQNTDSYKSLQAMLQADNQS